MRKNILTKCVFTKCALIAALFFAGVPAKGAISELQQRGTTCAGTSCALAFASNITAGSMIEVTVGTFGGKTINTPTHTLTGTFSFAVNKNVSGQVSIYYLCTVSPGGADTVTATISASDDIHLHIREVSGIATSACLDQTGTNSGTAATQTVSTAGATTTADEWIVAAYYDVNFNTSYTAISPYALGVSTGNAGSDTMGSESNIVSATGTQTATITNNHGADAYEAAVATFKGAGGGAPDAGFNKRLKLEVIDPPK
jgi:hypothetical protein